MARLELAPYLSTSPRVMEIWDEYEKDHRAWLRRIKKAEKQMAEAQGQPGEKARIWYFGRANDSRHTVIGVEHLRLPREDGEPLYRLTRPCPIPAGWRHLADDDYLTPIPENGRKGGDPKSPEAVAARELLKSLQPPRTVALRYQDEFDMPIMVWGEAEDNHVYWPAMEPVTVDGDRRLLICWTTSRKTVSANANKKGWTGGGGFKPIKASEYYALKGE